ncbi:MAG TPA: hypothetical protein VGC49_03240 [Solirubrobacterales bacterium]
MVGARTKPLLWVIALATSLWLLFPVGAPNYDTLYALLWGNELAGGSGPFYGPRTPTPHPLADAWGVVVSPLGAIGATTATTILAYLALAAVAYLVYRLGALWFDRGIGGVAAVLVLTRVPFLSNGLRAFVDLPYIALVLAALLVESGRSRAGRPVLALLAVAGLLRPEAWLFSLGYLAYLLLERDPDRGGRALRRRREVSRGRFAELAALAVVAPLAWAAFDLVTAGEPLYSFTATRDTVEILGRHTGPLELITYSPHELVQTTGEAGLLVAAVGICLAFVFLRRRSTMPLAALLIAGIAFAILASAGLAIISRYMMLGAALLCVFCAVALLGWRLLGPEQRVWRRRWQVIAGVLLIAFVASAPRQEGDLAQVISVLEEEREIGSDLHRLADSGDFVAGCEPISVPGVQAVPRLGLWLGLRPDAFALAGEGERSAKGYFVVPASQGARVHYGSAQPPSDFRLVARDDSWRLFRRCTGQGGRSSPFLVQAGDRAWGSGLFSSVSAARPASRPRGRTVHRRSADVGTGRRSHGGPHRRRRELRSASCQRPGRCRL